MITKDVTIKDVAAFAGVSTATVSRALSGDQRVREETRLKVSEAAAKLQYNMNHAARSLKIRATRTIGILAPELANDFFMQIAQSIENELALSDYTILLCSSRESFEEEEKRLQLLKERGVDGIIVFPSGDQSSHFQKVVDRGTPLILLDRNVEGFVSDAVLVNNEGASYDVTRALIQDGCRRIGFLGGDLKVSTSRERFEGYFRAMAEAGLAMEPNFVQFGDLHMESGYAMIKTMLAQPDPPQAYFIVNQFMHLGATNYLMGRRDLRESDIVFASFDEMFYAPLLPFCRYGVAQPMEEMGKAAANLLLDRIEGRERPFPEILRLETRLIKHAARNDSAADLPDVSVCT
jgi:LacI family transcriptional regulator